MTDMIIHCEARGIYSLKCNMVEYLAVIAIILVVLSNKRNYVYSFKCISIFESKVLKRNTRNYCVNQRIEKCADEMSLGMQHFYFFSLIKVICA